MSDPALHHHLVWVEAQTAVPSNVIITWLCEQKLLAVLHFSSHNSTHLLHIEFCYLSVYGLGESSSFYFCEKSVLSLYKVRALHFETHAHDHHRGAWKLVSDNAGAQLHGKQYELLNCCVMQSVFNWLARFDHSTSRQAGIDNFFTEPAAPLDCYGLGWRLQPYNILVWRQ